MKGFLMTPMIDYLQQQELLNPYQKFYEDFALKKENNLTKIFEADLKYRLIKPKKKDKRPQRNLVLEIFSSTAKTGSGKSTIGITCGLMGSELNGVEFTAENNIHFTIPLMKESIKKNHEIGSIHLLDEQRASERYGIGSSQYLSKISDLTQICRKYGLSFFRIIPNENRINIQNPPHYRFDSWSINAEKQENLILLQDSQLRYRGHIILKRKGTKKLWKNYEAKKDEFIEATLTTESIDSRKDIFKKMIKKLSDDESFKIAKNKGERIYVFTELFGIEHAKTVQELIINGSILELRKKGKIK